MSAVPVHEESLSQSPRSPDGEGRPESAFCRFLFRSLCGAGQPDRVYAPAPMLPVRTGLAF